VDDLNRASKFYGALFGWDFQAAPFGDGGYAICLQKGRPVAGIGVKPDGPGTPAVWTTYLASDDADETLAKVQAAGGKVRREPVDVMDQVRLAVAEDPGGAVFGVWQSRMNIGVGQANEPGSLAWSENWSPDFEANRAFYHSVFGYDFSDTNFDGTRYAFVILDGHPVGGIGELKSGFPAQWSIVFAVEDPHKAVGNATQLGGSVEHPPIDVEFGSTAVLRDDQGAIFGVTNMSVGVCPHGNPTFDDTGACMSSPPCP
jgi:hypothetical protein